MIVIPFVPASNANFQFQATLDDNLYLVVCTFNAYGQRYYFTITDLVGNVVLSRPMVESPDGFDINLIGIYFITSTLVFRESSQSFEIGP